MISDRMQNTNYITELAMQLQVLAAANQDHFLAFLLKLVVEEGKSILEKNSSEELQEEPLLRSQ